MDKIISGDHQQFCTKDFIDSEIQSIEEQLSSLQFGFYNKVWNTLQEAAIQSIKNNFYSSEDDHSDVDEELVKIQNQEKLNEFVVKYKLKGSLTHTVADQFSKKDIISAILDYMAGVCIKAFKKDYDQHANEPLISLIFKARQEKDIFTERLDVIINDIRIELESVKNDYYSLAANRDIDGLLDRAWEISPLSGIVNGIVSLLAVSSDMLSGILCCLNPFDETPYAERVIRTGRDIFSIALSLVKMKLTCILAGFGVLAERISNVIADFLSALLVSLIILCYKGSIHSIKKPNKREINGLYLRLEMLKYIQHSQWQIDVIQRINKQYTGLDSAKQQMRDNLKNLRSAINDSRL